MNRSVAIRLSLAAIMLLTLPATTTAQESPEGIDWHLVRYAEGGDVVPVPWFVEATLRLEGGDASGSGGCNGFSGTYELEGESLQIEGRGSTLMGCVDPKLAVEDAYLAVLPGVVRWEVATVGDERTLTLRDAATDPLLVFETPALGLTRSELRGLAAELDALRAQIDRHEERIDNIRIGTLRDRIRTLEAQVAELSAARPDGGAGTSAFNPAEAVLLEAIPADIAADCVPRRSDNPQGTVAALQCKPDSDPVVRDMAYYLMNEDNASKTWRRRMREWGVRDNGRSCWKGEVSQAVSTGSLDDAGCYVDGNGRANLRYATEVTNCRQLDAGDRRLKRPAVYIAVLGEDGDIAKLTRAVEPREWAGPQDLVERIERPEAAWDSSCPR